MRTSTAERPPQVAWSTTPTGSSLPMHGPTPTLYTDAEFLDVVARTYFPGQSARPCDYRVAGQVYRLLTVQGHGPVVKQPFIDRHEPLQPVTPGLRLPSLGRLEDVAQAPLTLAAWAADPAAQQQAGAPTLMWSTVPCWNGWLESARSRDFVADTLRHTRQLKTLLGDTVYRDDDTGDDVLISCMAWRSARDREARRPDLFAAPANRQFFTALRDRGLLRASTLRAGGRLLAVSLGAVHQGRCSSWVAAFNPDRSLRKYSLSQRLLLEMLASSHRAGHREFDFSVGLEPYKLLLASHVRPIGPAGVPPVAERLASAGRSLLSRHPWCTAPARVLRGWLQTSRR